jgi:ESF2/ABP1 family protein
MSRVPPFMRPAKVRDLLAPYGEVGRIYLKPEGTPLALRHHRFVLSGRSVRRFCKGSCSRCMVGAWLMRAQR